MAKKHIPDKSHAEGKSAEPDFKVTLKPFLGMRPGLYLTIIYAIIVLFIIYLVLFLPGIRKNGIFYRVGSNPGGAAIWVDDMYAGAAPTEVFVPKGSHRIRLSKPYFGDEIQDMNVRGRVFGSLIIPKRRYLNFKLALEDGRGLLSESFSEISRWALIDKVFYNYQIPNVLYSTASDMVTATGGNSFASPQAGPNAEGVKWLKQLPLVVSNEYILKDYISAASLITAEGGVLSPTQLLSLVREASVFLGEEKASAFWLSRVLPDKERELLQKTEWYGKKTGKYADLLNGTPVTVADAGKEPVIIGGIRFAHVPGGSFVAGGAEDRYRGNTLTGEKDLPYPVSVDGFYVMDHAVTWTEFEAFTENIPEWEGSNNAVLSAEAKVTESYLKKEDITASIPGTPKDTLYNVSWWAARAFCAWLSEKLPKELSDYEVRLPNEEEWERAVKILNNPNFTSGFWEWCDNWYFPEESLFPGLARNAYEDRLFNGAEVEVRGGSWANQPGSVSLETRGSQPPEWCTPFLGFRAIIVPRQ